MIDLQRSLDLRRWSLQRQIQGLGLLVLLTVALATLLGVHVLRQTETVLVVDVARQMDQAADNLVARYDYLRTSFQENGTGNLLRSDHEMLLRSLTEVVLAGLPGMEGGFFAAEENQLLGYAYPTYHGSGPKIDIPTAERPTIQEVAKKAVALEGKAERHLVAGPDVILFRAQVLLEAGQAVGAVWLMHRFRDIRSPDRQLYSLALIGLLAVAGMVAVIAWALMRRLDRGVSGIEIALREMEDHLETPVSSVGIPELNRIGTAINRLASTLRDHQDRRAALEQRLRQADRLAALGRLVAGLAHEVRNPLASIKLKLQLTRRSGFDRNGLAASFDVIEDEVARLDRLVERLLPLAKPSGPRSVPIDLTQFLAETFTQWESRAAVQGVKMELRSAASACKTISLDRDRTRQIIDNLLANALDALVTGGGQIFLEAERRDTEVVMAVSDTGPGVARDAIEHIFDPFFTTKSDGTGLGLFLSAEMARALGGELHYRDRPGGGACFEVRLPC